ncbi:ATP-binding protein [Sphaerimonospora thailandensis]|uniref:AAA+ ATPase domain-containing protein n=1 Tax=Sphaerimonospora thailandensis TaxID=795644 RepID=A0A8J3R3W9_9ACTN|nr:ATP-binding protein [Sphaerimonospora thailandensis]GIH68771.1 hypothetical protein Mth01_10240 [Sphaerimonospora thailandensis]
MLPGTVPRLAEPRLELLAGGLRVVIVNGPRQGGKSTLLQAYHREHGGEYLSLDDEETLRASLDDPIGFPRYQSRPTLIDEVQRGGDALVRGIKLVVDETNHRGQFILSGSSRFLTVPNLSESLAGRAGFIELWPLASAELHGGPADFCDQVFKDPTALLGRSSVWRREDYLRAITRGGFPEAVELVDPRLRKAWYDGYLATVTTRDITDFAQIHQVSALPTLMRLVAARSGGPFVLADVARGAGLSPATAKTYAIYLETVFQLGQVPAWSTNLTSKITKSPRMFVTDSGLAAHLLNVSEDALLPAGHPALGGLVETFVYTELLKLRTFSETPFEIHHYRDRDGREIDFILESSDGRVVGLEVKASSSPGSEASKHLRWLKDRLGDRMLAGAVLHLGTFAGSHGGGIYSMPVSSLWGHAGPWPGSGTSR